MGQKQGLGGGGGGEQRGLSWLGGTMLLSLHLSIPWLLISKDPLTDWLSHMEMEKRGYALSCYCMSVCAREREMRLFPGFTVWCGHTGQHAGQAALLLHVSELWNRAQLYWPSVCLIKLCTINGLASWDWNHNPQGTFQQTWFEFQVAVKYKTRWVSCGFRFCWKPFNQL